MSLLDELTSEGHLDGETFHRRWMASPFSDGLPVVSPAAERIAAMLEGRDPARVVAVLAPSRREATLGRLAACAVLAGCAPGILPLLAAAVAGTAEPQFNLLGVQTTTGNAAAGMLVHGPLVGFLELNAGGNTLGPGAAPNAALGRALAIALRAVGEALPGRTDMATLGQPAKFGMCCAENTEENTAGKLSAASWPALHLSRGCAPGESAVTVFSAMGLLEIVDGVSTGAEGLLTTIAQSITGAGLLGGEGLLGGGTPLLLLAPEHAALIAGEFSREQAQHWLFQHARLPVENLAPELRAQLASRQPPGVSPGTELPESVFVAREAGDILLAVSGGVGRKSAYLPSWGGGSRAVTRRVEME